jgi:hypothetical protein
MRVREINADETVSESGFRLRRQQAIGVLLQVFRHADTELRADVLAVERYLKETSVRVHGDCIGLARAGFEDDALGTELACLQFQGVDDLPSDATATDGWIDVHAFDFSMARFDLPHGTAADRFAGEIGDKKCAAAFGDFFGVESEEVRAIFGVDGIELGVKGED